MNTLIYNINKTAQFTHTVLSFISSRKKAILFSASPPFTLKYNLCKWLLLLRFH